MAPCLADGFVAGLPRPFVAIYGSGLGCPVLSRCTAAAAAIECSIGPSGPLVLSHVNELLLGQRYDCAGQGKARQGLVEWLMRWYGAMGARWAKMEMVHGSPQRSSAIPNSLSLRIFAKPASQKNLFANCEGHGAEDSEH